ncbi:hypothetical protein ACEPAH_7704 [Sanghuangporus vaninii]
MAEPLSAILASQQRLISEAAEAFPHQFSACTYSLGYIRQAVYLCLTCAEGRGICSACSIACHTDHEQVELFPKRHFRCDCPTNAMRHPCTLHKTCELENSENTYGQNFQGVFCRCGRPYDAKQEQETMIQCLVCEDWFHESCLNLRERPPKDSAPKSEGASAKTVHSSELNTEANETASEVSSSGLPPPLLTEDDYDTLICRSCVLSNPTLRRWLGTEGMIMVVRNDVDAPWVPIGRSSEDIEVEVDKNPDLGIGGTLSNPGTNQTSAAGNKRTLDHSVAGTSEGTHAKRPRTDSTGQASGSTNEAPFAKSACIAPQQPKKALEILSSVSSNPPNYDLGAGDVFLTDGWRSRWCQCNECLLPLKKHPCLLEEEETYEPPEDPDSGFSLEELGLRALQALPRDRAIDGIRAFNEMRDDLLSYLRPFAQEGKIVSESDIRSFFEEKRASQRAKTSER